MNKIYILTLLILASHKVNYSVTLKKLSLLKKDIYAGVYDVNACDSTLKDYLIHQACSSRCIDTVRYLITSKAHIHVQNTIGNTPLHIASEKGSTDIVETLLQESYTSVHTQNILGKTALHKALENNYEEVALYLIKYMSDVNTYDTSYTTALHIASTKGYVRVVDALIRKGAHINIYDKSQSSPLYYACLFGHVHIACRLIAHGAHLRNSHYSIQHEYWIPQEMLNVYRYIECLDAMRFTHHKQPHELYQHLHPYFYDMYIQRLYSLKEYTYMLDIIYIHKPSYFLAYIYILF
jgi:ankyrin repeat protein